MPNPPAAARRCQMAPEVLRDERRPWSWPQFAIALGLFPLSFLLWIVGMDAAFSPQRRPLASACLVAAPFVAIAGALWLLVLLVRRFTAGRRRQWLVVGALALAPFGLFFGAAALLSPPGREGETLVLGL